MSIILVVEQLLNGLQLGLMLFLTAAGLTLVFGIMDMLNLSHGSLFMIGAYAGATVIASTGNVALGVLAALAVTAAVGFILERLLLRHLYGRSHLDQVLVTYGVVLVVNELVRILYGPVPLAMSVPDTLSGAVPILPGLTYPAYRLAVIAIGLAVSVVLWWTVTRTRGGMRVRAGANKRDVASALGIDVGAVFSVVFAAGAALAGLAGLMSGPISAVQVGMGEPMLVLALVVTVIGGVGSVKGAFYAALMIGMADTFGRVMLPAALGSMAIFILMALVLVWRPRGLFPVLT
jgi:branched-chain amino acid transport system permease protein